MRGWSERTGTRRGLAVALGVLLVTAATACNRVDEVGEVHNPRVAIARDGAASAVVGGKLFWAFGDTFTATGGVHSSGAYADLATPTAVSDQLVDGTPRQLVPFSAAEAEANATSPDGSRWVIWPSAVIPTGADRALVFSSKFRATPEGWVDSTLVVSELRAGETVTERLAEPLRVGANYATGIYLHDGWILLHDCGGANVPPEVLERIGLGLGFDLVDGVRDGLDGDRCRLARVRPDDVADGSAYRYWTGSTWSASPDLATAVVPGTNSGLSVAWSAARGEFVALSNPGFSDEVRVSTAARPQGPWSSSEVAFTTETTSYAVRIHPHLSSPDLATMGVTWFRMDQPQKLGAIVLADVVLG